MDNWHAAGPLLNENSEKLLS